MPSVGMLSDCIFLFITIAKQTNIADGNFIYNWIVCILNSSVYLATKLPGAVLTSQPGLCYC
jgi:hypothetical protein